MFIGHFAPAFIARGLTDEAPKLGTLFIAAQLVDWAFFTLAMLGVERMRVIPGLTASNPMDLYFMPYTHSLLGTAAWAALFAAIIFAASRNAVAASWGAIVVISHWFLDWLVHIPDLTIAGGDQKFGLGLWNSPAIERPLEIGIVLLAYLFYIGRTKGPLIPPLVLLGTMFLFQFINWFGPEPEKAGFAMYATALFAYAVMTVLAYWVQSTRWHKNTVGLAVTGVRR